MTLRVSAYQICKEGILRHALTGEPLPGSFQGHCEVYFEDGVKMLFETGIEDGERYWTALGKNINYTWGE